MDSQYIPRRGDHSEEARPRRRLRRTFLDRFGIVALLILLIASAVLVLQLRATQMLSSTWLYIAIGVLALFNMLHMIVQLPLRRNKLGKLLCGLVAIGLSAIMLYASIATGSVQSALAKISGMLTEKEITAVIVLKDDPAQTINDAADYTFGYPESTDSSIMQDLCDQITQQVGDPIRTVSYTSSTALADALYSGEAGAILLNKSYISVLEKSDLYKSFSDETRILCEYTTQRQLDKSDAKKLDTAKPFVVYCSGIDARQSDINAKSLSDVNILAVINPQTHEILLVNTPRDYYIPLSFNGEMDKLTHAGIYGIDESMHVLSDLYGVDVSYYVRVNFNGLVNIVDALGGIDVDSENAFTTRMMDIPDETGEGFYKDSYTFTEGTNHLDGRAALAFSRERYSFASGDIQRGKNQMAVIKAIVNKAASPSVLSHYQELLKAVSDAFITNLSYDDMAALVKMQQKDMSGWHMTSYTVSGQSGEEDTYSGDYAYVMYPDTELIEEAKTMIRQTMGNR